ncbi:MAG TPA: membrane protein insertase YidC [Candidatus Acidoferrales bacterium]|nr:membrane protein insertase YidC [Candidatus Acidoferrales bacterium]
MSERKEMSTEMRSLLAAVLCLIVIAGWSMIYKPPQPPAAPAKPATSTAYPATPAPGYSPSSPASVGKAPASAAPVSMHAATAENSVVIESDLYRVEISNRGGVVRSWQLKKFTDDNKPPRTLDLVHPAAAQQSGSWPFALALDDAQQEAAVNGALFEITSSNEPVTATVMKAPADITMKWSDGHLDVTKELKFNDSYIVEVKTTATLDGAPLHPSLIWPGGFGDITAYRAAAQTQIFTSTGGKFNTLAAKNLGKPGQTTSRAAVAGTFDFAGIEDLYFAAAFIPPFNARGELADVPLSVTGWTFPHETTVDGKTETEIVPQVAVGVAAPGPLDLRVYAGPKSIDGLKATRPPLNSLVQFGWWGFIAEPLFYSLMWLHKYVSNYGWAIVLITIGINMVMFPLKVKSMRAMQKMQKVAPEVKAIQEKYKKYSMRDPRKAEMNKEVMAVYSREGINPLGSCWPTLIQMPIWFGLYRMLANTIELRHTPWFGWIHDLSAHDPYFILPVVMAISMYFMQKMTPTPGMDPAQAKMMAITPLIFGGMFALYPSGLSVYILTSNVVGIGQQWYLYRTSPPPPKPSRGPGKKK